jgi:hypothetical protein
VPLRIDLENPERESGLALDPLDEPSFLPVGMFPASEGEQNLVWGERSDVVLDRCHGGVVADRASHDARAAWDVGVGLGADGVHPLRDRCGAPGVAGVREVEAVPEELDRAGLAVETRGELR